MKTFLTILFSFIVGVALMFAAVKFGYVGVTDAQSCCKDKKCCCVEKDTCTTVATDSTTVKEEKEPK